MKADKYKIDSHKLMYHVHRVSDWISHENIYPIYVEISPTGTCNHRCIFCSVDFMGYQKRFLNAEVLKKRLEEMGRLGVRSIMYAGEGEPFLHKNMSDIIIHTKRFGIDVAVTTNGVIMKPDVLEKIMGSTKWIKVSCNAGTSATYSKVHRTKIKDFDTVIDNLKTAVRIKRTNNYKCTLGLQILLLHENANEVEILAEIARNIGVDYFVVKPYTHHLCNTHDYEIKYNQYTYLYDKINELNTDDFSVIFRTQTMQKWDEKQRNYKKCMSLPFWSYIDAGGNVWGCSAHLEEKPFKYGNIYEKCFQDIWEGNKRLQSLRWVDEEFDIESCKLNCRMDEINRYLWELKNPPDHVNFI